MPHLLFRGIPAERLKGASASLAEELAAVCGCGTDNFTMSCLHSDNVFGFGEGETSFVFIEVGWFERGRLVRNRFAEAVTRSLRELGIGEIEIVFSAYREDSYYINGEPVGSGS
ncbi:DUF1904 family protein [Paenibacillus harenae]|uniref:DUF1904 family protein n=1 Tax=Paenibacillus harenae TaxID=306543 RepID=UPI00040C9A64|nr:DUF1904 family protein [Paenibacillus harenae]